MKLALLCACALAGTSALLGPACVQQPSSLLDGAGDTASSATGAGTGGAGGGAATPVVSDAGLPCAVSFLLVQYCRGCHSSPPISGAHVSLMTYDDLVAPMPTDPATSVAEASLARMKSAGAPMPPGNLLGAMEVAPFEAWVSAGMPKETCGTDGQIPDTPMNPYDVPAVCTSMSTWNKGDDGSPDMLPGRACIACHSKPGGDHGPRFLFAGTVYPSAHEPDDCNGAGDAVIEVTDANGAVLTATARTGSGNFFLKGDPATLPTPIKARVLYQGKVLAMSTAVMTGDCNTCHTQEGKEGAPGRIILPP
ncbi:MAG: hypothetical protein U0414_29640 [Polyangiaceae bacterium]